MGGASHPDGQRCFGSGALVRTVHAESEQAADAAYWEIDNNVVVSGQLYESTVLTAEVLTRLVCAGRYTAFSLGRAMDLLVEFAYGESDQSEIALGNGDLGSRCRDVIRPGVSCIELLISHDREQVVMEVVDLMDRMVADPVPREAFLRGLPLPVWSKELQYRVWDMRNDRYGFTKDSLR